MLSSLIPQRMCTRCRWEDEQNHSLWHTQTQKNATRHQLGSCLGRRKRCSEAGCGDGDHDFEALCTEGTGQLLVPRISCSAPNLLEFSIPHWCRARHMLSPVFPGCVVEHIPASLIPAVGAAVTHAQRWGWIQQCVLILDHMETQVEVVVTVLEKIGVCPTIAGFPNSITDVGRTRRHPEMAVKVQNHHHKPHHVASAIPNEN